jgi:hypothetical protein
MCPILILCTINIQRIETDQNMLRMNSQRRREPLDKPEELLEPPGGGRVKQVLRELRLDRQLGLDEVL